MPTALTPHIPLLKKPRKKKKGEKKAVDMRSICCLILGGGQGSRLFPLTQSRCKPAISLLGRYRLIDIPLSNALHSGIEKIFVLTQFLAASLHKHIFRTYRSHNTPSGFIELLAAEQKPEKSDWYQGTADAIRQNLDYLKQTPAEYFLILSGDHLYSMDFQKMVSWAVEEDVDVAVAGIPISKEDTSRMGILRINEDQHITHFAEKPTDEHILDRFSLSEKMKKRLSVSSEHSFLASMGIYLFKRQALFQLLEEDNREDFGKHLIPKQVEKGNIGLFLHNDYFEDIGTIQSFYKANIDLTKPVPPIDCHNEKNPIFSAQNHLPGPKITDTSIQNSIICEGALCDASLVKNSILGKRAVVKKGTIIEDSYIMGNEFYTPDSSLEHLSQNLYIDEGCIIKKAIIDKNVSIGKRVQLINKHKHETYNGENIYIRDGIIIVPRGASLPDDFIL